jgi:hypothetical protein
MFPKSKWESSLSLLFLVVSLTACASFEADEAKMKRVKTIGIVSAVGDEFNFTRAGLNGSGEESRHFPILSWQLDDLIVGEATAAIGQQFQVQPLSYDRTAFYTPRDKKSAVTPINLIRGDPLEKFLRTVSPQGLDAYVVIVKSESTIGPSDRTAEGIGAVSYSTLTGTYDQIHTLYEIKVFDGHTFKLLETRPAAPLDNIDVRRLAGPSKTVDASYMPSAGDPVQNEKLKATITDMIEQGLHRTLLDLHLASTIGGT